MIIDQYGLYPFKGMRLRITRHELNDKQKSAAPNPSSSEFEANNWQLSKLVLECLIPKVGIHPFPLNEQLLMAGTVARFKPGLVLEWGTHVGKSALIFHYVSRELGLNTLVHSIDLPKDIEHSEHPHEKRGELVLGLKQVVLHEGDGINTSLGILSKNQRYADRIGGVLFFVDGDHDYESVKRELSAIIIDAPKAVVLLHDTFYQSSDSGYNTGPYRAINDCLLRTKNKYKRIDTSTGLPGMTLLFPQS